MNNKGFAITTVLYGTFLLFMMLLLAMLGILSTYKDKMEILIENTNGARDIIEGNKDEVVEEEKPPVDDDSDDFDFNLVRCTAGRGWTGKAQALVYTGDNYKFNYTFYWSMISEEDAKNSKNTTIPTAIDVGDYTVYWYSPQDTSCWYTGGRGTGDGVECAISCSIICGTNNIYVTAKKDLKYDGTAKELVSVANLEPSLGNKVYFSMISEEDAKNSKNTTIPTGTEAGTYTVYYYTEGHKDSDTFKHRCTMDWHIDVTISP